jgi:hypothetical protein
MQAFLWVIITKDKKEEPNGSELSCANHTFLTKC